ncbi:MAG: hypothetical protein ACFFD2_19290 [Promethearchaeota archaeon]
MKKTWTHWTFSPIVHSEEFKQLWCIATVLNNLRELIEIFSFWKSLTPLKSRISMGMYQSRLGRFLAGIKLHSTQELDPRGGYLR